MSQKNVAIITDLMKALRKTTSAHNAVREGIATHAEKHRVALHEAREKISRDEKIADGAKRANSQLCSAGKECCDERLRILESNILGSSRGRQRCHGLSDWY